MDLKKCEYFNLILNSHYNFLVKQCTKYNYKFIYINGENCNTVDDLFSEFSDKFHFPDYFGYNWPAFDECLNDLSWLPADGYVLLIGKVANILPDYSKDFETFIKLLYNTVYEWVNGRNYDSFPTNPTPFYVFIECNKENITKIRKLLEIYNK